MTERPQLPAPAWTAGADGWPCVVGRYRPATIKAWVALAPPAADARVKLNVAAIAAGEATATTTDEDGKVQVFASLEDWPLRTDVDPKKDFGNADPPRIQCLVVRVLHPDKKPVFVRPAGVTFDASEQRFYGPSAAVTAVFQTNKDQLDAKLPGGVLELDLVSVEKFKADRKPLVLEMGPARPEAPLIKLNPPERAGDKGK